MKKVLISLLLVFLAICLFVGCSSSPKEDDVPQSISFTYGDMTVAFNRNGSGTFTDKSGTIQITYTLAHTEGLFLPEPIVLAYYKDAKKTKITSVDELFSLSSIYWEHKSVMEEWTKK